MSVAGQLIKQYNLQPHPEGGWYSQTYKSNEVIEGDALPGRFGGSRAFSTAIYYLLEQGNFSAFHRIKSDECWHFYSGDPLLIYIIKQNGGLDIISLGDDFKKGHIFQFVVPASCWFAGRPAAGSEYCFAGCTVSPGFEYEDFDLANGDDLSSAYPQHKGIIKELCR